MERVTYVCVCPHLPAMLVQVETSDISHFISKEFVQMPQTFMSLKLISNWNSSEGMTDRREVETQRKRAPSQVYQ
jgi:hypothetical protein